MAAELGNSAHGEASLHNLLDMLHPPHSLHNVLDMQLLSSSPAGWRATEIVVSCALPEQSCELKVGPFEGFLLNESSLQGWTAHSGALARSRGGAAGAAGAAAAESTGAVRPFTERRWQHKHQQEAQARQLVR